MADMNGFLKALNLMAGDAGSSNQEVQDNTVQHEQVVNKQQAVNLGGEDLTCLIGIAAPMNPPANWVTEVVNGEQISYDPLLFRRGTGGQNAAKSLVYCGPMVGTVQQPIGITDYSYMFAKLGLSKVNLDRWEMSKAKSLEGMFSTCMSLLELRINSWRVGKCRNMSHMLENCINLNVLYMSDWSPDNLEDIDDMFKAVDTSLIPDWYEDWC